MLDWGFGEQNNRFSSPTAGPLLRILTTPTLGLILYLARAKDCIWCCIEEGYSIVVYEDVKLLRLLYLALKGLLNRMVVWCFLKEQKDHTPTEPR